MEKTEFLNKISNMNRDQIRELLNSKVKRVKKIAPAVIIEEQYRKGDFRHDSRGIDKSN